MAIIVSCWWIAFFFPAVFQCHPVDAIWSVEMYANQCFNQYAWSIAHGTTNILTDIVILGLPLPLIWKLQIRRKRKVGLLGIFLLGSLYIERVLLMI